MIERLITIGGIIFGIFAIPTLFKRPLSKIWISLFLINCVVNFLFDKVLVETNKVKYPIRFLPNLLKINVVYDLLVCPFLSVWYCQSTYNSKFKGLLGKLLLVATPQALYEVLLERKTDTLKFKGNWKWIYSLFLVFVVKIISRIILEFLKKPTINNSSAN